MAEPFQRWAMGRWELIAGKWRNWLERHPRVVRRVRKTYVFFSWLALLLSILCWIFIPETRKALIQLIWSYYVLWQFWFIARSKTLTWTTYARFFTIGAWIIGPLTAVIIWGVHGMVSGDASSSISDNWSEDVLGPIVEELAKLLPLMVFLLFSKRAKSFSVTDYLLVGAATGVGFDFIEEVVRRWGERVYDDSIFGVIGDFFNNSEQVWAWDVLFPGYVINGDVLSPGHYVWTGFVTLTIGFAARFRAKWGKKVYLIPLAILAWAMFDHGAYNATIDGDLPPALELVHEWTGQGHYYKTMLIVCFGLAILLDYRALNRSRYSLPLLPNEKVIEPISEVIFLLQSMWRGPKAWGNMMSFLRERRQIGFSQSKGMKPDEMREVMLTVQQRQIMLRATLIGVVLVILFASDVTQGVFQYDSAYFAGLLADLADWWNGLEWYEKAGIIVTSSVIGGLLTLATGGGFLAGGFTGLGLALTVEESLENKKEVISFMEDPWGSVKQWVNQLRNLPPQEAAQLVAVLVATKLLERIPFVKIMDKGAELLKGSAQSLAQRLFSRPKLQTVGPDLHVQAHSHDELVRKFSNHDQGEGSIKNDRVDEENNQPIQNHLQYTSQDTKDHVHYGDTEMRETSPYYGKWNSKGLHNWSELIKRCDNDGFKILDVKEDPITGARRVTIERSGIDVRGKTISNNFQKTVYPKGLSKDEIDLLGESALIKALKNEPLTQIQSLPGNRGSFMAKVKMKNGVELTVEGWFKELPDGSKEITTHCPAYDVKNQPSWINVDSQNW
ncbi:PrsW family glutamic-type intramembrane protease [Laceyella tengchongensis]